MVKVRVTVEASSTSDLDVILNELEDYGMDVEDWTARGDDTVAIDGEVDESTLVLIRADAYPVQIME